MQEILFRIGAIRHLKFFPIVVGFNAVAITNVNRGSASQS